MNSGAIAVLVTITALEFDYDLLNYKNHKESKSITPSMSVDSFPFTNSFKL